MAIVSFGFTFLFFSVDTRKMHFSKIIPKGIFMILIFLTALMIFYAFEANMKIIECTACTNGIRSLGYNITNYGKLVAVGVLFSIIPSLISKKQKRKNELNNKTVLKNQCLSQCTPGVCL